MSNDVVTLQVYRFDPEGSASPHYDEFRIPYSKGLTVLEGLIYIYENIDPSLSFRWSCKNVQCGTCGMIVNGEAVLACERKLNSEEVLKVEPFPLPIIKDLVTDFSYIEDKRVRTFSKPTWAGRPESLSPEEVSPLVSLHKCLDCHICDVVCPLNKGKARIEPESFLPADLVQLSSILSNQREGEDRRDEAYSKKIYNCLTCGACVKACPVGIDIVNEAVERLRYEFMKRDGKSYRKLFNPVNWVDRWVELKGQPFLSETKEEYRVANPKREVAFFVGCLMNRRQQDLAMMAIKTLNKAGYDVLVPKGQKCCGQPLLRLGMVEEAKELLKRNVSLFEATGVAQVVTACPDCSFAFGEDYQRLFGNDERRPRIEVLDLIKMLPNISTQKPVACHNPCYLSKRGMRLSEELRSKGIPVEEVVEECCGAGGGVYFTNRELGLEIGGKATERFNGDTVVTGCPFCEEQFKEIVAGKKRIVHYLELF
jgi:succinate dehydrogenase/fumarate reductase iron-sulfur protein